MTYDVQGLDNIIASLSPAEMRRGLRQGFRDLARSMKRKTINELRHGQPNVSRRKDLEAGIKAKTLKSEPGFYLTIAAKGKRGSFYAPKNLKGKIRELPLLLWYEMGTTQRTTKTYGKNTGSLKSRAYLKAVKDRETPRFPQLIGEYARKYVEKIARQNGSI